MPKDWSRHKAEIEKLYIAQGKALKEVQRLLKGRHEFNASIRAYRMKLDERGITKNGFGKERLNRTRISPRGANDGTSSRPSSNPENVHIQSHLDGDWSHDPFTLSGNNANSLDDFDFGTSPSIPNLGSVPDFNTRNTTDVQDPSGPLSLHAAISFGTVGDVSNILSLGASVDTWNSRGYQPLHGAVIKNDIALVKVLLRYRANVQSVGFESKTPIRLAASSMKILCLLLEKSPAVSQQDQAGNTVLHLLLQQEEWRTFPVNVSAIRTLLSCGADINVINNATESPLHLLVAQILPDSDEHLKLLLIFLNAIRTYLYQRLIDQLFSKRY